MMRSRLQLVACIAWAGAAVSTATPADARLMTYQTGDYGTCSNESDPWYESWGCDTGSVETNYVQVIKLVDTTCASGDCARQIPFAYTDQVYAPGRYLVTDLSHCDDWNLFQLGACAC